jgi:putative cell wall-binding protein
MIALVLFLQSIPQGRFLFESYVSAAEIPVGYSGIYKPEDIANIRNNLGGNYILMNDIDLSDQSWQPIGTESTPFTGILDGNGHKVIGMNVSIVSDKKVYAGLFGYIKDAEVKNVGIENSVIYAESTSIESATSDVFAGAIAGFAVNFSISNTYNSGSVTATSLYKSYAGGIVGNAEANYQDPSSIVKSYNTGQISAGTSTGGIVGKSSRLTISNTYNKGSISKSSQYAGGITGYDNKSTITNSYNTGVVTFASQGGGIGGYSSYTTISNSYNEGLISSRVNNADGGGIAGSTFSATISNSYNKGKIDLPADSTDGGGIAGSAGSSSIVKSFNTGDIIAGISGGGIAGSMSGSTILQTYNAGLVKNASFTGGIGGWVSSTTIADSYNIASISGKYDVGGIAGHSSNSSIIKNTYNLGLVNKTTSIGDAGGIAGDFQGASITNSYYADNNDKGVGSGLADGTSKSTLEAMRSLTTFKGFDFNSIWTMSGDSKFGFPELINTPFSVTEKIIGISIKSLPNKTTYIQGEDLDLTGAMITVTTNYSNKTDVAVTPEMVQGYYSYSIGEQMLMITYEGFEVYFDVTVKDITPPEKPIVNEVKEFDKIISGTAEPEAIIDIKYRDSIIRSGRVAIDGKFEVTILHTLYAGAEIFVTARDESGNVSESTKVVVKDVTAPGNPNVYDVTDSSKFVTGNAEISSLIEVKSNGALIGSAVTTENGSFSVPIPIQPAGVNLAVTATDAYGNVSFETIVTVIDATAPSEPKVNDLTDHENVLTGTAEPHSTVFATVAGMEIRNSTADSQGKFSIDIPKQTSGEMVEVYAVDSVGNTSSIAYVQVKGKLQRLIGDTRYSTAVKVSQTGWKTADTVLLVNGFAIVDGLTATPLASAKDAPILLTTADSIPKPTMDEITRLKAKEIILIGGDGVITPKVASELVAKGFKVTRIGGLNRKDTSLSIAKELDKLVDVSTIHVAYGWGEPDALSIAAQAGLKKQPIILADKTSVPADTLGWLKTEALVDAYFIGGDGVVAPSIISTIDKIASGDVSKNRISGLNRHETNAKVISKFYPEADLASILVAKSETASLVDALAAGPLAAKLSSPVLLISSYVGLLPEQKQVLAGKNSKYVHQIGGGVNAAAVGEVVQ